MLATQARVTAHADKNGSHFQGEVTIAGAVFSYDLKFVVPIEEYVDKFSGKTTDELRRAIDIRVSKRDAELQLENDEWRVFYYLVMMPVVRIHNDRLMFPSSAKEGGNYEVVTIEGGTIGLKAETCYILSRPKFGCQLLDLAPDLTRKPS